MNYRRLHFLFVTLLLTLPIFFTGCDGKDDKVVCRLLAVQRVRYKEEYSYNTDNKVQTILRKYPWGLIVTVTLEYNNAGQLVKFTMVESEPPNRTFVWEIIYDSKGKPRKLYLLPPSNDPSQPALTFHFYHDVKGRLVAIENVFKYHANILRRFEYDENDNVTKVFSHNYNEPERLDYENLEFDNKPSLYYQMPELEIINVYYELFVPVKNNVLKTKVYTENIGTFFVTFNPVYDESGLILNNTTVNNQAAGIIEFSEVKRDCQ